MSYCANIMSRAGNVFFTEFDVLTEAIKYADDSVKFGGAASAEVLDIDDECVYGVMA